MLKRKKRFLGCLRVRTCRICQGRGTHYTGSCGHARREPCPACNGTGLRPARPKPSTAPAPVSDSRQS